MSSDLELLSLAAHRDFREKVKSHEEDKSVYDKDLFRSKRVIEFLDPCDEMSRSSIQSVFSRIQGSFSTDYIYTNNGGNSQRSTIRIRRAISVATINEKSSV